MSEGPSENSSESSSEAEDAIVDRVTAGALSGLHDGHLLAIAVDDAHVARLTCRPLSGAALSICLKDVIDFCANNFRQGNIILSAEVHTSVDRLDGAAIRALAYSDRPEHVDACKARLRAADATGALRYFVLQSSYGCDLVATFRGAIEIEAATPSGAT